MFEPRMPLLFVSLLVMLAGIAPEKTSGKSDPLSVLKALDRLEGPGTVEFKAMVQQVENGPHDLAVQRAAARREGIPVSPVQLWAPLPSTDRNAGPIYTQLARILMTSPLDSAADRAMTFLGWQHAATPEQVSAVKNMLAERRDVVELVHQAAERSEYVVHRNWARSWEIPFPELAPMRRATYLLRSESYLLAKEGRYQEAVANQTSAFRIAEHAASEPNLTGHLVSRSCYNLALYGMESILYLAGPNAQVDEQVCETVASRCPHLRLRRALGGEIAMVATLFNHLRQGGYKALAGVLDQETYDSWKAGLIPFKERRMWMNLCDAAEADYLHQMRRAIAAIEQPYLVSSVALKHLDDQISTPEINPVYLFRALLLPEFTLVNTITVQTQTAVEVLKAGASVLAYKARHGTFPERLEEALPPPLDPFSGKPLQYRREGDGFVVYSVGPDGSFEGGKPGDPRDPRQAYFRYPAPPPQPAAANRER